MNFLEDLKILPLIALAWAVAAGLLAIFGYALEAIPVSIVSVTFAILSQSEE